MGARSSSPKKSGVGPYTKNLLKCLNYLWQAPTPELHVYKSTPEIGEELSTVRETSNTHDRFAVTIRKGTLTIGHVPAEISKVCWFFLRCGVTSAECQQTDTVVCRWARTDLCSRRSEAIEEPQKDFIYMHTQAIIILFALVF